MHALTLGPIRGCIGRITELHATYYTRAAGFGLAFEARVARELTAFCEAEGFRLIAQAPGGQWGRVVNEQRFERLLPAR